MSHDLVVDLRVEVDIAELLHETEVTLLRALNLDKREEVVFCPDQEAPLTPCRLSISNRAVLKFCLLRDSSVAVRLNIFPPDPDDACSDECSMMFFPLDNKYVESFALATCLTIALATVSGTHVVNASGTFFADDFPDPKDVLDSIRVSTKGDFAEQAMLMYRNTYQGRDDPSV